LGDVFGFDPGHRQQEEPALALRVVWRVHEPDGDLPPRISLM
jgi:hypothetical protein